MAFKEYNVGVHAYRELVRLKEAVQCNYIHGSTRWYEKDCAFTTSKESHSQWCRVDLPILSEVCRMCMGHLFGLICLNSYRPDRFVLIELKVVRGQRHYTASLKEKE